MSAEREPVAELMVRVYDRGPEPEWHKDRRLFGPWWRYEATLVGEPSVVEVGCSPGDAVYRLVAFQRREWLRRWPAKGAGER